MKHKTLALAVMTVAILAATVVGANQVSAAGHGAGGCGKAKMGQGRQINQMTEVERQAWQVKHDAVTKAIEANDYNAWVAAKTALGVKCPMMDKITAENFGQYAEAQRLQLQAGKIMKGLGFEFNGFGIMKNKGVGMGQGCGMMNKVSSNK